ncbi:MAG: hypothetical protein OEX12_08850 [Gammaproteobacteria bacterium]|nr:hypothetical protein [Gammaproteobacteria bacterium]
MNKFDKLSAETVKGNALKVLAGQKQSVVAGTTAATNIALAGAAVGDVIQSVIMYATGVPSDVTAEASITSAGNLQLSTTNSSTNTLVVTWLPGSA